jgi:uncharacterized protein
MIGYCSEARKRKPSQDPVSAGGYRGGKIVELRRTRSYTKEIERQLSVEPEMVFLREPSCPSWFRLFRPLLPLVENMIEVHDTPAGAAFAVKVQPRAPKNAVTGELGGVLKLALTAPPVEGKANEACIEFLANLLKVPRSSVTIASGIASRRKVIRVAGLTAEMVCRQLER